jgi:hypothetical protein
VMRGFKSSFSDTDKFNVITRSACLPNFFGAKFTAFAHGQHKAFC